MEKKKFTDQAFLFALKSFEEERRKLIDDSLEQSAESADLYDGLLENKNTTLREIEFERYELLTLKRHWECAMEQIEQLPETEYYANLKLFVKVYRRYIADIRGTMLDMNFLDANLEGLDKLLDTNKNWEENLKKLHIDFKKSKKKFDDNIEILRKAEM